jgi:uncharacterized membrane protein
MDDQAHKLATGLGWASLGLGIPQTLAPGRFARFIGVEDDAKTRMIIVGPCGLRENAAAAGLLTLGDKGRAAFVWSRVAGDVLDIVMLVRALRGRSRRPARTAGALGAVLGITAVDVYTGVRFARAMEQTEEQRMEIRHAITVRGARADVERRWREFHAKTDADWYSDAAVVFTEAPGNRGTEIHVRLDTSKGTVGLAVAKVIGADEGTTIKDDMRRFKQVFETGEVVRSEGSPEGQTSARLVKQRPAQPLESVEALR